jgi:hypothetical protein
MTRNAAWRSRFAPSTSRVGVGVAEDGARVLKFTNNCGTKTTLALHRDAADVLLLLLLDPPEYKPS